MTVILLKMVVADPDDAETAVDLLNDAIDACPRAAFKLRTRAAEPADEEFYQEARYG